MTSAESLQEFVSTTEDRWQAPRPFPRRESGRRQPQPRQQLISQDKVRVNGQPERASLKLRGGETIAITGTVQLPPLRAIAEDIPLDIVYEDDDLAIVNNQRA